MVVNILYMYIYRFDHKQTTHNFRLLYHMRKRYAGLHKVSGSTWAPVCVCNNARSGNRNLPPPYKAAAQNPAPVLSSHF